MSEPIIELKDVCFAYDEHVALRHIDLHIHPGETVVLQGSNGCGKSTMLKLLNGLISPNEGTFKFRGEVVDEKFLKDKQKSKKFHQQVGFIFQNSDIQLFCGSVEEEIAFGPLQMGLSDEEVQKRVDDVIRLIDIEKLRDRAPYHLSGGEKKKVALACILSMNPDVLVLDAPLAGLDQKTQDWLVHFLRQLQLGGKTLIISTHNYQLAELVGHRFVMMNEDHEIEAILRNHKLEPPHHHD